VDFRRIVRNICVPVDRDELKFGGLVISRQLRAEERPRFGKGCKISAVALRILL
jgi:hypothetical protein